MRHKTLVTIMTSLVLVALIAAVFVGCDRSGQRAERVKRECIASGGTWISITGSGDNCVRSGGAS